MLEKRQFHKLVALNGRLLAIGGRNKESGRLDSVECYDPFKNKWQLESSLNQIRSSHALTVHDNKIYVFGGNGTTNTEKTAECYVPSADQWITVNIFKKNNLYFIQ